MRILNFIMIALLLTISVSAIPTLMSDNQFGRNLYYISNITKVCFVNGDNCINASTSFAGNTYLPGLGLNLTGTTFNLNTSFIAVYNDSSAILILDNRESANNATQAALITAQTLLQAANNNTQAVLIAGLQSDNTTQAALITSLFNANTTLWNRQSADNTTLTSLLNAEIALQLANNNTQASQIATEVALQAANNATQASLISSIDIRESANNNTQASLITILFNANTTLWNRQSSDNTTLTATKAGIGNCAAGGFVNGTTSTGVLCGTPAGGSGFTNGTDITVNNITIITDGYLNGSKICTSSNGVCPVGNGSGTADGTGGWINTSTDTNTSLKVNILGNVTIGNSTSNSDSFLLVRGKRNKLFATGVPGVVAEFKTDFGSTNGLYLGEAVANRPTLGAGAGDYLQFQSGTTGILFTNNAFGAFNGLWANTGNLYVGGAVTATGQLDVDNGATAEPIFRGLDNSVEVFRIADGGNVGIRASSPASHLTVNGSQSIGTGYQAVAAPANGIIIEGDTSIGDSSPTEAGAKFTICCGTTAQPFNASYFRNTGVNFGSEVRSLYSPATYNTAVPSYFRWYMQGATGDSAFGVVVTNATASERQLLTVDGSSNGVFVGDTADTTVAFKVQNLHNKAYPVLVTNAADSLLFRINDTGAVAFATATQVGIGTGTTANTNEVKLQVQGGVTGQPFNSTLFYNPGVNHGSEVRILFSPSVYNINAPSYIRSYMSGAAGESVFGFVTTNSSAIERELLTISGVSSAIGIGDTTPTDAFVKVQNVYTTGNAFRITNAADSVLFNVNNNGSVTVTQNLTVSGTGISVGGNQVCTAANRLCASGNPFNQGLNTTYNVTFNNITLTTDGYLNGSKICTAANGLCASVGGGGNPFNQVLNTTHNVTFNSVNLSRAGDVPLYFTDTAAEKTWIIQTATSGTLQNFVSSNGATILQLDANSGGANAQNLKGTASYNGAVPLTVQGASGQTANLLEIKNTTGNVIVVSPNGTLNITTDAYVAGSRVCTSANGLCASAGSPTPVSSINTGINVSTNATGAVTLNLTGKLLIGYTSCAAVACNATGLLNGDILIVNAIGSQSGTTGAETIALTEGGSNVDTMGIRQAATTDRVPFAFGYAKTVSGGATYYDYGLTTTAGSITFTNILIQQFR